MRTSVVHVLELLSHEALGLHSYFWGCQKLHIWNTCFELFKATGFALALKILEKQKLALSWKTAR